MKKKIIKFLAIVCVFVLTMSAFGCETLERKNLPLEEFEHKGLQFSSETTVYRTTTCADLINYYEENSSIEANFLYLEIDGLTIKPRWETDWRYVNAILLEKQDDGSISNHNIYFDFYVYDKKYGSKKSCQYLTHAPEVNESFQGCVYSYPIKDINGEITLQHVKNVKADEAVLDYLIKVFCGDEEAMSFYYALAVDMPIDYFENFVMNNLVKLTKDKGENL